MKLHVRKWSETSETYDVVLGAVGFESRGPHAFEKLKPEGGKKIAPAFPDRQLMSFPDNLEAFSKLGFETPVLSDQDFTKYWNELLTPFGLDPIKILVDISCLNRYRMASIVEACFLEGRSCSVDFVYSVAKPGKSENHGPIDRIGPVLSSFAGWSVQPQLPAAAIFGVGYEQEKAIGCLENLEPQICWAFRTQDDGGGNYDIVTRANELLWQSVPPQRVVEYSLRNVLDTFITLEAVAYGAMLSYRPVLIPFGPKIFFVSCLLVAVLHHPMIPVWRAVLVEAEPMQDRVATGEILGIHADNLLFGVGGLRPDIDSLHML